MGSGSRSSRRSPTSSRSGSASRAGRPCASSSCSRFAATRQRRPQGARRLRHAGLARSDERDPAAGRAAAGQARRARLGDRLRRRRGRDQLHARAADGGRRPRRRVADHPRRGRVLQRHEGDPQRPAGRRAVADRRGAGDLRALQLGERRPVLGGGLRLRDHPRPAAGRDDRLVPASGARQWIWRGHIDFSTPNEQVFDVLLPSIRRFDAAIFHMREYVPQRGSAPGGHLAAGDRSADAEEHGALARGRRVHRRPVRHRRRAAAAHAGVAVRPVEGPARRDRRLPPGQAALPGGAARARRVDGPRRSGRLGLLQAHRRACGRRSRHLHPQQHEQRRARSR